MQNAMYVYSINQKCMAEEIESLGATRLEPADYWMVMCRGPSLGIISIFTSMLENMFIRTDVGL